jgi:hypothetical protein
MPRNEKIREHNQGSAAPFSGFALPTSNTTYTPNQFFDVCLPHHSRGVVRLVGYMIRKTLGWSDVNGNPQHETVRVSYSDLEHKAGVGHSMIRQALDEVERGGFVCCVREGRASTRAESGAPAAYELAWDESSAYIKDPLAFRGFFAGEGNRTYIPNQFFDHLLPNESLAVAQVVGAIIRFSIGFQNKFGHRRQRVALSYRDIQRYGHISSPATLAKAIKVALARNYIERVEEGYFDPNAGMLSRAAHYAVKWAQPGALSPTTPKSVAAIVTPADHSEKRSGTTPKTVAGDHSENCSGIQTTGNNTLQTTAAAVACERLKAAGFDARSAKAIADRYPADRIHRQIAWIDRRRIKANRLGMLRTAIDQDWDEPPPPTGLGRPNLQRPSGLSFQAAIERTKRRVEGQAT